MRIFFTLLGFLAAWPTTASWGVYSPDGIETNAGSNSELGEITRLSTADPFPQPAPAPPASIRLAHAILVKANPAKEAVVSDVPEEVVLVFNDPVEEDFLALAVIDGTGKRVDKHDAKLDFTDRSHLRASVEKLVPGRYTVRYRVLSADGHVVSGKYFFEVKGQ